MRTYQGARPAHPGEYVAVPATNLVPMGDVDPIAAAPLADAGLTSYHAIKLAMPQLGKGGAFALVIGLGGLGQVAVQILTALTGATVIATDMKEDAPRRAKANGAVTVPGGDDQVAAIRELTQWWGVDAAFDFVGVTPTLKKVVGMYRTGQIRPGIERFAMDEGRSLLKPDRCLAVPS